MTAARDAEGRLPSPTLPVKPAAHPSVQAVLARRGAGDAARPPAVIDAAAVSLDHPDLGGRARVRAVGTARHPPPDRYGGPAGIARAGPPGADSPTSPSRKSPEAGSPRRSDPRPPSESYVRHE